MPKFSDITVTAVFAVMLVAMMSSSYAVDGGHILATYRDRQITTGSLRNLNMYQSEAIGDSSPNDYGFWIVMLDIIKDEYLQRHNVSIPPADILAERQRLIEEDFGKKVITRERYLAEVNEDELVYSLLQLSHIDPGAAERKFESTLRHSSDIENWSLYSRYYNTPEKLLELKKSISKRRVNLSRFELIDVSMMKYYSHNASENVKEAYLLRTLENNGDSYAAMIKAEMLKINYWDSLAIDQLRIADWIDGITEEDNKLVGAEVRTVSSSTEISPNARSPKLADQTQSLIQKDLPNESIITGISNGRNGQVDKTKLRNINDRPVFSEYKPISSMNEDVSSASVSNNISDKKIVSDDFGLELDANELESSKSGSDVALMKDKKTPIDISVSPLISDKPIFDKTDLIFYGGLMLIMVVITYILKMKRLI